MSDLLPCPFCGETRLFLNAPNEHDRYGSINCPACLAALPGAVSDQSELVSCWNTRAGWEPIRTAPKDGSWILVYDAIHHCTMIAKYRPDAGPSGKYGQFIWVMPEESGTLAEHSVSHWMPLPAPPSMSQEEGS